MEETKNWIKEGDDWFEKGNFSKAIECYDKAIELMPDYAEAYYNKGYALGNSGDYQQAIDCFDKAIKINPNDTLAYNNKGVALDNLGDYQQAIEWYDKAIELKPDDAKAYYNKGVALRNLGDYQQAIECYDKAIELKPDDAIAYNNKGNALSDSGDHQQAIDCYDKAIELKPDDADAYNNKGNALGNLGEYEQAKECYDKAIELKPDYAVAYNNKGNALYNLGDHQQAIEYYDKAIELKPNYADAYSNKGVALNNLGNYQQAIECYDKAIELKPDYAIAYNNKGFALYSSGEYEQAIEWYDKAIELSSDFALAYNNKGFALHSLGKYEQAIECYDKVIELEPKNVFAHNSKGNALSDLGEHQQAIEWYDKAIKINSNTDAQNNKNLLSQALDSNFLENLKDIRPLYDSDFFDEIIGNSSKDDKNHYGKIYLLSLKILSELRIKETDTHETNVAHYTRKRVSQILFFDNDKGKPIPFRLNSVTNSNDIQEGKTLFNYLFDNQKMRPQSEHFVAFVGCFMFNFDNLNQFRLYGKDEGTKEGTGISIVMKPNFFSLESKSPIQIQQEGKQASHNDIREPLFRCIYIDPETNQVVSIGHRDFHTFYKTKDILYGRENKKDQIEEIKKDIKAYKAEIDKKTETVKELLEKLKNEVNEARKQGLDDEVICNLLLSLRYLVKHVAFKEEQECRIVKIKKPFGLDDNPPEKENHERFFVNYLPLKNCVKQVYFGPKATGMELFQSLLTYQEGFKGVICYRSTSPLA